MIQSRIILLFICCVFPWEGSSQERFSEKAWRSIEPVFQRILEHPFNQDLAQGRLDPQIFAYYKAQDAYYLKKFSQALAHLATKLQRTQDIRFVLNQAASVFDEDLSAQKIEFEAITPANFHYTNFLLAQAAFGGPAELVAALLPCYWIYWELALKLKKSSPGSNPFQSWIKLYSSSEYGAQVQHMQALFDRLALREDEKGRAKMLELFQLASRMEWSFWEDAYRGRSILANWSK